MPVSDRPKSEASCHPFPQSTYLLHVQLDNRFIHCCPQPFICASIVSSGCRIFTVPEFERIAVLNFDVDPRFPVFNVPHDGGRFPEELMASVCVPENVFMDYHERMRDKDLYRLIPRPYYSQHMCQYFEVSRLLCDVERFIGPDELMEQYGMGFCYEKAFDGTVIKHVTEEAKAAARKYYDEYHARVNKICDWHKRVLFIDLHSYTDEILPPHAKTDGSKTPDLCIGTDARYTPPRLKEIVMQRFSQAGFSVAVDQPYSGLYVPETVLKEPSDCDFAGIMLEFNRRVYCGKDGEVLPEKADTVKTCIRQIMTDSIDLE